MSEVRALAIDFTRIERRRKRQRAIVATAIGVTFLTSSGYWLSNSGVLGTTIIPVAGASSTGSVALVSSTTLNGVVTRGGNLTVGVPVSRIIVAKSYLDNTTTGQNIRISLAWTNAATAVLHGNDIVSLGLWYPVSTSATGSCHSGSLYVADSGVTGGATGVCVLPDTAATGGTNVDIANGSSQQGSLILSKASISGYLVPGTGQPSTIALCVADTSQSTWCQPPGVGDQSTDTNRTLYVLAQVVNHGGNVPPGQQPSPGDFSFFTNVKAIT